MADWYDVRWWMVQRYSMSPIVVLIPLMWGTRFNECFIINNEADIIFP